MTAEAELHAAVQKVIDDNHGMAEISPAWVATATMAAIEFSRAMHALGYVGCHLQIRQIARDKLRRDNDPTERMDDSVSGEDDLFPETLQDRYPRRLRKGEEPIYVLRDLLTDADVQFNVERMRRGGQALLKHARALEAWDKDRRALA